MSRSPVRRSTVPPASSSACAYECSRSSASWSSLQVTVQPNASKNSRDSANWRSRSVGTGGRCEWYGGEAGGRGAVGGGARDRAEGLGGAGGGPRREELAGAGRVGARAPALFRQG